MNSVGTMLSFQITLVIVFLSHATHGSDTCQGGTIITSGLTSSEKQRILDHHNYLRNQVAIGNVTDQPQAQNMRELKWSSTLTKKAQTWANGCVFEHNTETYNNKSVGQNLFMGLGSNVKDRSKFYLPETMVDAWFNEVYQYGYNGSFKSESGHYSQVIWGKTQIIGCGLALYEGTNDKYLYKYLVCNYFPAGNYIGQAPYVYGAPDCSANKLNASSKYDGLCA